MRIPLKLTLAALAASLLLAFGTNTASARNLSISVQLFRATWSSLEFNFEAVTIRCPVTLEGSFAARTFSKVVRLLIGATTRAAIKQEACTNGTASAFNGVERYNGLTPTNSLPWHVSYEAFFGTLPNITLLRILFGRFRFGGRDSSGFCTGQYGTAEDNMVFALAREAGGSLTGIEPVAGSNNASLFRRDGGLLCPATVGVVGRGNLTEQNPVIRIRVTLI